MSKTLDLPDGLQLGSIGYRVIAALFDAVVGAAIWYPFFHFWGHYNETENQYQVTPSCRGNVSCDCSILDSYRVGPWRDGWKAYL